jgi:GTPase
MLAGVTRSGLRLRTERLIRYSARRWLTANSSFQAHPSDSNLTLAGVERPDKSIETKFATIALVGAPNAGKSTLMNRIVGGRVAAVSRKVNTTRRRIMGTFTGHGVQLAFCDTPGVVERQFVKDLGSARRQLAKAAWGAAADSDIAVLVVDASRGSRHWETCAKLAKQLLDSRRASPASEPHATFLVLNKIDKARPRAAVLDLSKYMVENIDDFEKSFVGGRPYFISALNGHGVEDLLAALKGRAEPGEFLVPGGFPGALEDTRDLCIEHIWEKLLHRLHQELPYLCEFENEEWKELPTGDLSIMEVIRVERKSQIPIVIGPAGETIKWVAEQSSKSLSELLNRRVYLRLRVTTR